ncbi:MAG: hypothetical protein A4E31_00921 [Methanomassiliicoccales archaeon PtaU1.Bin030]|nr:MAG: hypothetical protein A4E31_00921 [Methanomassiliicoccales archaeon PtaU1.Bin030]
MKEAEIMAVPTMRPQITRAVVPFLLDMLRLPMTKRMRFPIASRSMKTITSTIPTRSA